MSDLIITPKTKVLALLEAYPQLEELLMDYAPAFKNLKNPVLRKTVAKIATLQQAAAVGHVGVDDLINRLREAVGQDPLKGSSGTGYRTERPDWFSEDLVAITLDAKEMLDAGEHPVNQVLAELKGMGAGKIYKLSAPFLPAPLIDKVTSLGMPHWVERTDGEACHVYFFKP